MWSIARGLVIVAAMLLATHAHAQAINTATVTNPAGLSDPTCNVSDPPCNSATDSDPILPTLTLVKVVINDDGGNTPATAWTLMASGPSNISGSSGAPAVTNANVQPGAYTLSESALPAGYAASTHRCTVNAGAPVVSNALTLAYGDIATCTITNNDTTAKLSLTKNVAGGPGVATDWTLSASGPTPLSGAGGVAETPVDAGTYVLSETGGVANVTYAPGAWSCIGGVLTGNSLVVSTGETVACSITNTYQPPTVTVSKSASAGPVSVGDTMTFSVSATVGTSMTTDVLTLVDTLGPGLTFGSVTGTGMFSCSGALTCTLPPGTPPGTYAVTYTATVDASATAQVVNTLAASGADNPSCNACSTSTPVQSPRGTLVKSVTGPNPARVGDVLTYTLTATVTGSQLLAPIALNDALGRGLTLQTVIDPGAYTCIASLGCSLPIGTPPGVYTITYTAVVNDQATGTVTNTVAPAAGPRAPTCVSCTTTTAVRSSEATIAKTSNAPAQVAIGDVITYTVTTTIANSLTTDTVTVNDALGNGLTFGAVTNAGAYTCSGALTCTLPSGTVPGTYPLVYTATVNAQANGSVGNSVSATGNDVTGGASNIDTELVAPVVTVRKSADTAGPVSSGELITFTIDVTIAQATTTQLATFTDTLGAGLDFVEVIEQAAAFTCNASNPLVCTLPLATPPGTYSVRYTARVNDSDIPIVTSTVVGAGVASTCDPCVVTLRTRPATLHIVKHVAQSEARVGDLVRYTLTIDNPGTVRATDTRFIDTPPPGFTLVDGSLTVVDADNATQLSNIAPITVDHIDIAPGGRATIAYLLRVGANTRAGTHVNRAHMELDGSAASGAASAEINVVADPIFDASTLLGTVFEDRDGDGEQDPGEPGIPGARIATVTGLLVETDRFGRYHIADIEVHAGRGSNVLLKLDRASLPIGFVPTTPNPLLRRVTPGLPVRFDFGVKQEVRR